MSKLLREKGAANSLLKMKLWRRVLSSSCAAFSFPQDKRRTFATLTSLYVLEEMLSIVIAMHANNRSMGGKKTNLCPTVVVQSFVHFHSSQCNLQSALITAREYLERRCCITSGRRGQTGGKPGPVFEAGRHRLPRAPNTRWIRSCHRLIARITATA